MEATHARGIGSTAFAFASVTLMLVVARNAGLRDAAPTGLLVVAGAVVTACVLLMALLRITRRPSPSEQIVRIMIESIGMLTVATPVVLFTALALGWL